MNKKTLNIAGVLALILTVVSVVISSSTQNAPVAHAYGLPDMAGDNIVEFYEEEIAKEKFISNMNPARKARTCERYGISKERLNAVLILQDLGARVGIPQNVDELAKMNDKALISVGKTVICAYIDTLTEEEKQDLKEKFKSALSR